MEEINLVELKSRKEELEVTLINLVELMSSRNELLSYYEKNVFKKTLNHMFSNLNVHSKGSMQSGLYLIKKSYELDLMILRRGQFFFHKRKRAIMEELTLIEENILKATNSAQVDPTDLSQSA